MINKTRIFLSSAYEEDLKGPRKIIKKHLEESGHEVPVFEDGDFGSWEKNSLNQCINVVKSSDVFVLLINKKAGANSSLLPGNVTPTYLEYKAAILEKKHILVFVSPEVKRNFMFIKDELRSLYNSYVNDNHRPPNSPFDPFEDWIKNQIANQGLAKSLLEIADPYVWAFIYDVYSKNNWLYDFDISLSEQHAKNISAMLSTSLRSVVGLISEREQLEELKSQASYLINYADYTLTMLNERNLIKTTTNKEDWSSFLEKGILFLNHPQDIIQAPEFNPIVVNSIKGCFAASLYAYNVEDGNLLSLIGTTGDITAQEVFFLDDNDVFVVEAFNQQERLIAYREDKQTLYITEPIENSVICLHLTLAEKWTHDQVKAYIDEIEYAIINVHDYFFEFLKLLIGGRT
jgi:hypothetical protein